MSLDRICDWDSEGKRDSERWAAPQLGATMENVCSCLDLNLDNKKDSLSEGLEGWGDEEWAEEIRI